MKFLRVILFLFFLYSFSFASYKEIYSIENPNLKYAIEDNNYKVYMSEEGVIDYKNTTGFKLFLPNFVKEYNLGVLRFNSIGRIDGYLSMSKIINPSKVIEIEGDDIKYCFTDYAKEGERQLDFLLNGYILHYTEKTSFAFQGYNIPTRVNTRLNKWVYFTFDRYYKTHNKLKYLVYSYSMILDKKLVDNFVKNNLKIIPYKDPKFNYIHTYISNLYRLKYITLIQKKAKEKKIVKVHKIKKPKPKPKKAYVRLNLKRLLYMKEFGYEKFPLPKKNNDKKDEKYEEIKPYINDLKDAISNLKIPDGYLDLIKNFDTYKAQLETIINLNKTLNIKMEELDNIKSNETSNEKSDNSYECLNFDGPLNKKCLNKEFYVNNYIYYAIKKDKLPPEEFILGYGNGKIFNDVAKYYFERGDFKKSESYLLKAYPILDGKDKEIVAFNLGVLYATINTLENNAKAVKYFKQTSFKEAYFNLGVNYYIGLGVKENDKKAYYYFKKAAEKGLERAKFNLTQMKKLHLNLKK
jgi:hypothetical protein